jgi:phosphoglycolate phosphatase
MAILTNKPIVNTIGIIEGLGLSGHFFRLYGGNSFEQKKPDPVGIVKLMEERSAAPARAVMIGDSAVDIRTARNAGVTACGVTYGFVRRVCRPTRRIGCWKICGSYCHWRCRGGEDESGE